MNAEVPGEPKAQRFTMGLCGRYTLALRLALGQPGASGANHDGISRSRE